jgi:hypothetical protein
MPELDDNIRQAATASAEELKNLVYHASPKVIEKILHNENLTEELALIIAERKNVTPAILEPLSKDARWKNSYPIKLEYHCSL